MLFSGGIGNSSKSNSTSTIGQANGNSNTGHVINITNVNAAEAAGGADGLSRTRDSEQQQGPFGLLAMLNPFKMLSALMGGGGSFMQMK